MAQNTQIIYVSDMSGETITDNDAPSLSFGWDGADYSIDLTAKEAEKFHKAIEPYLNAATKVSAKGRGAKKGAAKSNAAEVRAWAQSNGIDVPDRGRIPASVLDAYNAR